MLRTNEPNNFIREIIEFGYFSWEDLKYNESLVYENYESLTYWTECSNVRVFRSTGQGSGFAAGGQQTLLVEHYATVFK